MLRSPRIMSTVRSRYFVLDDVVLCFLPNDSLFMFLINPITYFLCIFSREDIWRFPARFWLATLVHRELYVWWAVNQFIICGFVYKHNVSLIPKFLIRGASFTSHISNNIHFVFCFFTFWKLCNISLIPWKMHISTACVLCWVMLKTWLVQQQERALYNLVPS